MSLQNMAHYVNDLTEKFKACKTAREFVDLHNTVVDVESVSSSGKKTLHCMCIVT